MLTLHALPDDFTLNSAPDIARGVVYTGTYEQFLVDTDGNFLTDIAGNFLVTLGVETVTTYVLHALPDDFTLNAE